MVRSRDLRAGEQLDGIGWYMIYGLCENAPVLEEDALLPMGLAEGCRVRRDVRKDEVLSYGDVDVPEGRLVDRLYEEQQSRFRTPTVRA